jgi:hypothetical protein
MSVNTPPSGVDNHRGLRRSVLSWDWLLGLFLIGAIFLAYAQTRHAGFIWDDGIVEFCRIRASSVRSD